MKMKRVVSAVLAGAVMLSLGGCKDKQTAKGEDNKNEEYEIIWYIPGKFGTDLGMVNEKVNEYVKEKINATVKIEAIDWGNYDTKVNNSLNAGEKIDIAWCNANTYIQKACEGTATDITELSKKYAPKTMEELGETFLKGCYYSGKLYGIPANKDKAHDYIFVYRKDIADKYNMDLSGVTCFEDIFPFFETVKQNEKNMYAFGIGDSGTPMNLQNVCEIGSSLVCFTDEEEDKLFVPCETSEFKRTAEQSKRLHDLGYIHPDVSIKENLTELRNNGQVFGWLSQGHSGTLEEIQIKSAYPLAAVSVSDVIMDARDALGSVMYIPFTCENPVRTMKFLELFNTDKYLNNLINFGIEGIHYEKTGEDTIKSLDKVKDYNFIGSQWVLGNTFINYVFDGYNPKKKEMLKEFNDAAKPSKYYGFMFNTEEVEAEVTACQSIVGEYWKRFAYGTCNIDTELAVYKEKLKKAGIDKVLECAQKQYDEWKKISK